MSTHPSDSSGPSRRSVTASAMWSIPVVGAAVAAPLAAASTLPCTSTTLFTQSSMSLNPLTLTATSPTGTSTSVRITSVLAADTTTTPTTDPRSFNLTQDGTAWYAGGTFQFANEVPLSFYEPGLLLLNQRRAGRVSTTTENVPEVPTPGSDSQTLIFEFFDADGNSFDPTDVQLTVLNISSDATSLGLYWALKSWSTVGFSVAPTSISSRGGAAGVGAGTIADPFRRATAGERAVPLAPRYDTFTFRSFPSGSSLVYSQFGGFQGWHSSAITGLGFRSSDC
ncbi:MULTISPECIES: hypothetical protein [unclassified Rathayibacter]|uniref:hypothetical protein n=1 Tax=unclassified Rathayibacter TaxID=2609250 RepID=UPI000F4C0527|nr:MULTISPECIES: hypothetical protein [unclassified Rathayibacter]MCJ1702438.1 hypothetical protein [Rathayibacter sp. VKM Ac-2926]ROP56885.1 hypothetical protein EDF45_0408 [Rathayibacter sp. PhB186]ROS55270.1 hypothetical protein EDF44_0408 [Rathayibacter sp. PhB185]